MKTMMTKRFWAFCLCSLPLLISAQSKHIGYDRIKAIKMSFIVEKSALTAAEETAFWPIYERYEDLVYKKIRHQSRDLKKSYKYRLDSLSNEESYTILKQMDSLEQLKLKRIQERNKTLIKEFGAAKVLKILYSEELFNKEMFHRSKNRKDISKVKNR